MEGCNSWWCLQLFLPGFTKICTQNHSVSKELGHLCLLLHLFTSHQKYRVIWCKRLMSWPTGATSHATFPCLVTHLACNVLYDRWRFTPFHLVSDFDFSQANILGSNLCKWKALNFTRKVRICGPPWSLFPGYVCSEGCVKKRRWDKIRMGLEGVAI